jgi:hypothetical protein
MAAPRLLIACLVLLATALPVLSVNICPNGFSMSASGNCFSLLSTSQNTSDAALLCAAAAPGATLATIATAADDQLALSLCKQKDPINGLCFLGA